jgi:hypothetical protein
LVSGLRLLLAGMGPTIGLNGLHGHTNASWASFIFVFSLLDLFINQVDLLILNKDFSNNTTKVFIVNEILKHKIKQLAMKHK